MSTFEIGNFRLKNPVVIAPMAGITDKVNRAILREMGPALLFTEMVSAKALLYQNKKSHLIMDIQGEEGDCGIQIFGPDPKEMGQAAKIVAKAGARLIDINMGCPVPKVVDNREGAALLLDLPRAIAIAEEVVAAVDVPVTVKMRKGFDPEDETALELAGALAAVGVKAVTVHGRSRTQYYSGEADWDIIRRVKEISSIPVIGNGDIFAPEAAGRMLAMTKCDGVMLGRGIFSNPWLARDTVLYLNGREPGPVPTLADKVGMTLRHMDANIALYGDYLGVRQMRKFWYLKGHPGATALRKELILMEDVTEIKKSLLAFAKENT